MDNHDLHDLIRRRRAIFPPVFTDQPISEEVIRDLLEAANWAPTHRRTEPWRFQVFRGPARERLAAFMADTYTRLTDPAKFSDTARDKMRNNVLRSDTVILLILQRDPQERIPEWEEVAALGAAVQNLWLSATAHGLGGYWSSPGLIREIGPWLMLPEGQRCLGIFYLGHYEMPEIPGQRNPVEEKTVWHNH
jgi:nitroreductase